MERITVKILRPCRNSVTLVNYMAGDIVTLSPVELSTIPRESVDIIERVETRATRVEGPKRKRTRAKK